MRENVDVGQAARAAVRERAPGAYRGHLLKHVLEKVAVHWATESRGVGALVVVLAVGEEAQTGGGRLAHTVADHLLVDGQVRSEEHVH